MTGLRAAVALIVVSFLIAILIDVEDLGLFSQASTSQPTDPTPSSAFQSPAPADSMSLLQGANVHVDLLGMYDKGAAPDAHSQRKHTKDVDDTSFFGGVPITSKSKRKAPDVSLASMSGRQGVTSKTAAEVGSSAASFRAAVRQMVQDQLEEGISVASTGGLAVVMLVLIIGCTCVAALSIVYPERCPWGFNREDNLPEELTPAAPATVRDQRELMLSQKPPAGGAAPFSRPGTGPWGSALSPFASALMPAPMATSNQVPPSAEDVPETMPKQDAPLPPPLCPTLVMPICEARFGVPMYELAQLNAQGELNIVGLSGNPLLRAVVRKIGTARTLEISMPEQNSAPRATISPSTTELSGLVQQGSRALEIRGMRGSFYGILEMRSSGACYVVKDGQTVLTIDGDAESLQLSIKSSVGLQLASVRCSAEPFGGVDHVEIRVEPGVDTVLVLAVVLAVLLLSPYLPPPDQ